MINKESTEQPLSPQSPDHENYDKLDGVLNTDQKQRRSMGGFISGMLHADKMMFL